MATQQHRSKYDVSMKTLYTTHAPRQRLSSISLGDCLLLQIQYLLTMRISTAYIHSYTPVVVCTVLSRKFSWQTVFVVEWRTIVGILIKVSRALLIFWLWARNVVLLKDNVNGY